MTHAVMPFKWQLVGFLAVPPIIGMAWAALSLWDDLNVADSSVTNPYGSLEEAVPVSTFLAEAFLSAFVFVSIAEVVLVLCFVALNRVQNWVDVRIGTERVEPVFSPQAFAMMPTAVALLIVAVPAGCMLLDPTFTGFDFVTETGRTFQLADAVSTAFISFVGVFVSVSVLQSIVIVVLSMLAFRRDGEDDGS